MATTTAWRCGAGLPSAGCAGLTYGPRKLRQYNKMIEHACRNLTLNAVLEAPNAKSLFEELERRHHGTHLQDVGPSKNGHAATVSGPAQPSGPPLHKGQACTCSVWLHSLLLVIRSKIGCDGLIYPFFTREKEIAPFI